MSEQRLGDVIDDHCIKCRRITNHSIVSIIDGKAAKVRCRTCYHDHDYRFEQAPPSKKFLKAEAEAALAREAAEAAGEPESAESTQPDTPQPMIVPPGEAPELEAKPKAKTRHAAS